MSVIINARVTVLRQKDLWIFRQRQSGNEEEKKTQQFFLRVFFFWPFSLFSHLLTSAWTISTISAHADFLLNSHFSSIKKEVLSNKQYSWWCAQIWTCGTGGKNLKFWYEPVIFYAETRWREVSERRLLSMKENI